MRIGGTQGTQMTSHERGFGVKLGHLAFHICVIFDDPQF